MIDRDQRDVISTWMLMDDDRTASYFPQAGRVSSADASVHELYWRCVAVFFAVARRSNQAAFAFRLYTNVDPALSAAGPAIQTLLRELEVEVVQLPFTFNPPDGYFGAFRNQFYIFDILQYIAAENTGASHLVLDSDSLCLRPLDAFFTAVRTYGALTLSTGIAPGQKVNGLTREEMQEIFRDLGCGLPEPPEYFGGELFAATGEVVQRLAALAGDAFRASVQRFHEGKIKFNEEAHLLSYLYYVLGITAFTADPFARTIWTGLHFHNGVDADRNRSILHLPTEKRFGFVTLYKAVQDRKSWFYEEPYSEAFVARIHKIMSIPQPSKAKLAREALSYGWARLHQLFNK